MKKVLNITNVKEFTILDTAKAGEFRFIIKTKAGFTCTDAAGFDNELFFKDPGTLLNAYKPNALLTVQFRGDGSTTWLTIFSRKGKKVSFMDSKIFRTLTVGTINQLFYNTNLYNMDQYKAVNAKTWACKAFIMNQPQPTKASSI